jgi:DNA-binding Lrp family transcriptional regulator
MNLDRFDRAILQALQLDGRITNSTLAERVNLSESACLRRMRALEESGIIEGYTARINQQRAGCPVNVFVNITLDRQDEVDLRKFEEAIRKIPEVMECYLMTGDYDYTLRVVVADTADYERFHSKNLTRLPGVARIHSSFALRTVQKSKELPIR